MAGTLAVQGLQDLNRAFARAPKKLRTEFRQGQREIAEPIRLTAQSRALSQIRNMPRSQSWGGMRTGVTQRVVYVAPKKRGVKVKGRHRSKRPNLANLLLDRAMVPALEQHASFVARRFDDLLATVGRDWER